ncbi:hypothetical protein STEG23_027226, partial [Scotinomys teguina]
MAPAPAFRPPDGECSLRKTTPYLAKAGVLICLREGGPPGSSGNYGYANSGYNACEEENDRLTESLRSKVTAIKSLSIEIGHEVKNQNKLLAEM